METSTVDATTKMCEWINVYALKIKLLTNIITSVDTKSFEGNLLLTQREFNFFLYNFSGLYLCMLN